MAATNGPDDFDRFAREAGEGLRNLIRQVIDSSQGSLTWADFAAAAARPRTRERDSEVDVVDAVVEVETGVWAIVLDDAGPRVLSVFSTELEALRANASNVDPRRSVRFIEFGQSLEVAGTGDDADDDGETGE